MSVRILTGDCREVLRSLESESVNCVVTSPPYWGLRDYGNGEGGIGLEATLAEHIAALVDVFAEVRRVLRADGTLWLNYGDAYAGSWGAQSRGDGVGEASSLSGGQVYAAPKGTHTGSSKRTPSLKPKDLIGLPWRLAFALQEQGWWLRSDIIWAKPNPMPESIKDRPTRAHEYVFLLTKAARYWYDADAIAEPAEYTGLLNQDDSGFKDPRRFNGKHREGFRTGKALTSPRNDGNAWNENNGRGFIPTSDTRNVRTVWTIATSPFPEAHFATFPTELAERCIKAGCPVGGTVLDPFFGAGTVGLVADRLQRSCIGIELNPTYAEMARKRIEGDAPMFAQIETEALTP